MNARFALKAMTERCHAELDAMIGALNLARRDDYRTFLAIHGAVVPALEEQLDAGGLGDLVPGWAEARRTPALLSDMAALDVAVPDPVTFTPLPDTASVLGAAYVLEGSRLGGRLLERQVGDEFPRQYLSPQENRSPWPALIAALDRHLDASAARTRAGDAAISTFAAFARSARWNGLGE